MPGKGANSAYDVSNATVRTHAVWWLWPTTCLMRYPGRSSMIVLNIIPAGPERTLETYDFYLETPEPTTRNARRSAISTKCCRPKTSPSSRACRRGWDALPSSRAGSCTTPTGSGKSEHAVHHFHGLVLDAYATAAA
jgi:hypothetical protein